jgi:hypothetical protein
MKRVYWHSFGWNSPYDVGNNVGMNQVERARRYAQLAYSAAVAEIVHEYRRKRYALWARMAAQNRARSFLRSSEEARLESEEISVTIKAQLSTMLDGYELSGVPIDEDVAKTIFGEVARSLRDAITPPDYGPTRPVGVAEMNQLLYRHQVIGHVRISRDWIRDEINRRHSRSDPPNSPNTPYYVDDHAPRVGATTANNSVSALIESNKPLFVAIRQKVESCLADGYEKAVILNGLQGLQQAQDAESLARCLEDFISAAAKHIFLLKPFLPALIEMVDRALRFGERLRA